MQLNLIVCHKYASHSTSIQPPTQSSSSSCTCFSSLTKCKTQFTIWIFAIKEGLLYTVSLTTSLSFFVPLHPFTTWQQSSNTHPTRYFVDNWNYNPLRTIHISSLPLCRPCTSGTRKTFPPSLSHVCILLIRINVSYYCDCLIKPFTRYVTAATSAQLGRVVVWAWTRWGTTTII